MTAHKHAEMIKAKADNMDLVVLRMHYEGDWIEVSDQSEIRIKQSGEYFLCLPKHKNAVLNGLNGGDFQVRCLDEFSEGWYLKETFGICLIVTNRELNLAKKSAGLPHAITL